MSFMKQELFTISETTASDTDTDTPASSTPTTTTTTSHVRSNSLGNVLPTLHELTVDDTQKAHKRILVTSGSGVIGYRVAMSLLEAGYPPDKVRVGIYQGVNRADEGCADKCAAALRQKGADVIDFDWTNEEDFDEALRGVSVVVCKIPNVAGWQDVFPKFVRKCMYKNVQHFIKISFLRAVAEGGRRPTLPPSSADKNKNPSQNHMPTNFNQVALHYRERVPFCSFHGACDYYLTTMASQDDNPMHYTILATSHLMTKPLFLQGDCLRKHRQFVTASYGMGINYVSPNDVADAAVVVILQPTRHYNKIYNLTGPGPITDSQVAKLLSQAYANANANATNHNDNTEKKDQDDKNNDNTNCIQHLQLGYNEYVTHCIKHFKLAHWQVKDCAAMERMKASGVDELPFCYTQDLKQLTGKDPETFADFLLSKNHSTCMRPGMAFP